MAQEETYRWQIKTCSMSYAIREIQMKTTVIFCYIPVRMAQIQDTDITKCFQDCRVIGIFIVDETWYQHFGQQFDSFS